VEEARSSSDEAVDLLLSAGEDPAEKDREGKTALHAAAEGGRGKALQRLLRATTHLEVKDDQGRTPFFSALVDGQGETAALLLKAGASPWSTDGSGLTALEWAARFGKASLFPALASAGLDVDQPLPSGHTLLTAAAAAGQEEVVEALLTLKADPLLPASDGKTALQHAAAGGHSEVVRRLKGAAGPVQKREKAPSPQSVPRPAKAKVARRRGAGEEERGEAHPSEPPAVRPALLWALLGVILLGVVAFVAGRSLSAPPDPTLFPPPQDAARATLTFVQEEIEAFRARFGRLPQDVRELGLEGTGEYRYLPYADGKNYRLEVTVAGWTESVDTGGR